MAWDDTWEKVFQAQEWGKYPPEELVRFVARCFKGVARRKQIKILEVGCGPGANVWFLAREGFDVYGVDGSPTAIRQAQERLEQEGLRATLVVGDIISLNRLFPEQKFDAVIDVGCLSTNRTTDVEIILQQIYSLLKPGGRLFSMLIATGTFGEGLGREIEPGTFDQITEGPLAGKGVTHFFSLEEVRKLMQPFIDVQIEASNRSLDGLSHWVNLWVVQGVKGL